ncbi:MAG: ion transporter [Flavobacteriales bacterium]
MAEKAKEHWKSKWYRIIYKADTPEGRLFDVILLIFILLSVAVVMLESVPSINDTYETELRAIEWVFTIFFTIEYFLRVIIVSKPKAYIFSFYGIIDFLSTIPNYLIVIFGASYYLAVIRVLRLLRVFRILKLVRYIGEANKLKRAFRASWARIWVFILAVFCISIILGTIMYLIEGPENGYTSIPRSFYWAIVTLTTVGFGDISPQTPLGQFIATIIMILGYGIIAIPTGLVSSELTKRKLEKLDSNTEENQQTCSECLNETHANEAKFCHSCGEALH